MSEKKKPMGRPSKYKPEYCQSLIEHMASGLSFLSFAAVVDVNEDTLYEWEAQHKDFSDAKKTAFSKNRIFWEQLGIKNILNESESFPEGGSSSRSLNSTVWIFNMKNRFPKEWRDKQEIETKQEINTRMVFDTTFGGKTLDELESELEKEDGKRSLNDSPNAKSTPTT